MGEYPARCVFPEDFDLQVLRPDLVRDVAGDGKNDIAVFGPDFF